MTSANTKGLGGGFIDDGDGGGDDGGQVLGVPDRRSRCQDTNEIENSSTAVVIGHTNMGEGSETGSGHIFKQLFGHRREIDAPFVTTNGLTIQNTSVLCGKVKGGGDLLQRLMVFLWRRQMIYSVDQHPTLYHQWITIMG